MSNIQKPTPGQYIQPVPEPAKAKELEPQPTPDTTTEKPEEFDKVKDLYGQATTQLYELILGDSTKKLADTVKEIKQLKEKFKYDTESLKTQCLDDIKKVCSEYQEKIDKLQTNYDKFIVENQKNIDETIRKALEPVNLAIKGIEKKENANQERVKKVAGIFGKASELLGGE